MTSLARYRQRAAVRQGFRCYYCGSPIWLENPDRFAATHGLSRAQARLLRCTAEHLEAKRDGGTDRRENIVAACEFCNQHRHRARNPLPPTAYRERVVEAMSHGRWLAGVFSGNSWQ